MNTENYLELLRKQRYLDIARAILTWQEETQPFSNAALVRDPEMVISDNLGLVIQWLPAGASFNRIHGKFDPRTNLVTVYETGNGDRDVFTLLHELGHYMHTKNFELADAIILLGSRNSLAIEEHICNAYASLILIPDEYVEGIFLPPAARDVRELYKSSLASYTACFRRITALASSDPFVLALVSDEGKVHTSASSDTAAMAPPPAKEVQPSLRDLIMLAEESGLSDIHRPAEIRYRSGNARSNLVASVNLDEADPAICVITETEGLCRPPSWTSEELECVNPACGHSFAPTNVSEMCASCESPFCPECRSCCCSIANLSPVCPLCFMTYAVAELEDPSLHEC